MFNKSKSHKDFNRGSYIDRYSVYSGASTPKSLVERTYKSSGNTYRMHSSGLLGGIFGKSLGKKRH